MKSFRVRVVCYNPGRLTDDWRWLTGGGVLVREARRHQIVARCRSLACCVLLLSLLSLFPSQPEVYSFHHAISNCSASREEGTTSAISRLCSLFWWIDSRCWTGQDIDRYCECLNGSIPSCDWGVILNGDLSDPIFSFLFSNLGWSSSRSGCCVEHCRKVPSPFGSHGR